jgi:predicted nucleic acid-binding protein
MHRYTVINKREVIGPALHVALDIADEIFPIEKADVMRAAEIVQHETWLSARDAIHIAVMEHHGVSSIFSFDADFDRWHGLKRIHEL